MSSLPSLSVWSEVLQALQPIRIPDPLADPAANNMLLRNHASTDSTPTTNVNLAVNTSPYTLTDLMQLLQKIHQLDTNSQHTMNSALGVNSLIEPSFFADCTHSQRTFSSSPVSSTATNSTTSDSSPLSSLAAKLPRNLPLPQFATPFVSDAYVQTIPSWPSIQQSPQTMQSTYHPNAPPTTQSMHPLRNQLQTPNTKNVRLPDLPDFLCMKTDVDRSAGACTQIPFKLPKFDLDAGPQVYIKREPPAADEEPSESQTHTDDKPFGCPHAECNLECNKSFKQKSNLKSHISTHSGQKPFECLQCTKSFTQRSSLLQHQKIHSDDKPYICTFGDCAKRFKRKDHLKSHLRSHTGEKPEKCTQGCDRRFATKQQLRLHVMDHTGQRPFECTHPNCGKRFKTKSLLSRHSVTHALIKPFGCENCLKRFSRKVHLNKHKCSALQ